MTRAKKKSKLGRPRGLARPGSGRHPTDKKMATRGYVTIGQAAKLIGTKPAGVYQRIHKGLLKEGADYVKSADGHAGAVYILLTVAERLRDERAAMMGRPVRAAS